MAILRTIINSSPFNFLCCAIGYTSFCSLAFFTACFACTVVSEATFDKPKIIHSSLSPDGKLKVVVYEHAYPIGRDKSLNVSVIDANAEPEHERSGNLFSFSDASAEAQWVDDQHVQILHTGKTWRTTPFTFIAFDGRSLNVKSVQSTEKSAQ